MTDIDHGTYAGWNTHVRNNVPVCEPCKLARNAYMRSYRKGNDYLHNRAAQQAYLELARRHRPEYLAIMAEIRKGMPALSPADKEALERSIARSEPTLAVPSQA